jgi:hypothetical protein
MPRYFFHIFNDETSIDDEGQELPDLEAARQLATREARILMCETLKKGQIVLSHHIAVEDDQGTSVFDVKFGEAVQIKM